MAHRRYIHIIHPYIAFAEILSCYKAASSRLRWMSAVSWNEWSASRPEWQDPNNAIILWLWGLPGLLNVVPPQRKAMFAVRYMESVGPLEKLCPVQRPILGGFLKYFKVPDIVIVGSPSAAQFLRPYCKKVAAAPIGYDSGVMGTPDWTRAKEYDFGYCGWPTGRRDWIIPALRNRFGKKFFQFFGIYGPGRKRIFDQCRVALHIPHSEESYLSSERIWHFVASSATLVTEKRDVWPAVAGRHYIELPEAKESELDLFVDRVEQTLRLPLEEIARRAHSELSIYTIEKAMEYITAVF